MAHVEHESIGARARTEEEAVVETVQKRKELVARFNETPYHKFGLDQLTVWTLWFTAAVSFFLFCTVSAVQLAVR